jgi:tRNA threonylcarbamoyladenosine modification (KEOPS) complex  Pcc1 subunit
MTMPHGRRVKNLNFKNKCSKEKEGARCLAVFAAAESHTLRSRICTILRLISTSVRLIEQYKTTLTQQENV